MSEVKVDKISPRSGTDVTLGDASDTFTIPASATLDVNGTIDVTGATKTGFPAAGLNFISTATNNAAVATWDFTDVFTSTYSHYFMTFENVYLATTNQELRISIGNSDLSALETGDWVLYQTKSDGSTTYKTGASVDYCDLCYDSPNTEAISGWLYFLSPQDSGVRTTINGRTSYVDTIPENGSPYFFGDDAESHVSFRLLSSSGNLGSASYVARVTLYGLSES
jgi:hypothetical protein|tara:strand:- start:1310 stop:1981 length:672 start_codon:yes stop_codon:yes gene_type:complete